MGEQIRPQGWNNWGKAENEKTAWYGEVGSQGPGAHETARVSWAHQLTEAEAAKFKPATFLRGSDHWNPTSPR
jgi:pectinesterase